ncbi:diacylglycerol kinase [Pseudothauera lacus]|uniref:Diacylglycerol kinase n=1 Tax=Pseudothauera lacus TaxID=2136175 RepID=A0A2T4ICX9_9RHOO|nr:diacylglycerol kinase [Pseudothauera lacus]PTD95625.1 diacylglycerol kinase [Pseudothauera lacus]
MQAPQQDKPQESPFKGKTGLVRVINAFGYSLSGLRAAFRHEDAFRQECLLAAVLIPLALVVGDTAMERALLIGSTMLVLIVELLNSAVEATVDRVSLERHQLAKRAKDIGSAAVLLSLFNLAAMWALVLFG